MNNYGIKNYYGHKGSSFSIKFNTQLGGYVLGIYEAEHFIDRKSFQNMLSDEGNFSKKIEEYNKNIIESLRKNKLSNKDLADIFDVVKKLEDEEFRDFKRKGSKII